MKYKTFEEFEEAVNRVAPEAGEEVKWTIGGMDGGNCWGDSADQAIGAEDEPEDEDLEMILFDAMPDLTFLEFRKLNRADIYERDKKTQNEYYGNYTIYATRRLKLKELYDALVDISSCR